MALAVRRVLADDGGWEPSLGGACAVASLAIVLMLRARGVGASFASGSFRIATRDCETSGPHCWVVLPDGSLLDVTATQFDEGLPPLLVAPAGDPRYALWRVADDSDLSAMTDGTTTRVRHRAEVALAGVQATDPPPYLAAEVPSCPSSASSSDRSASA